MNLELDWLHKTLACPLLAVTVAWWVAWQGWHACHAEQEIIVLQVREWQVEELWSDELDTDWKGLE